MDIGPIVEQCKECCHAYACLIIFGYVINSTAYHLCQYEPSSPSNKELLELGYSLKSGNRYVPGFDFVPSDMK